MRPSTEKKPSPLVSVAYFVTAMKTEDERKAIRHVRTFEAVNIHYERMLESKTLARASGYGSGVRVSKFAGAYLLVDSVTQLELLDFASKVRQSIKEQEPSDCNVLFRIQSAGFNLSFISGPGRASLVDEFDELLDRVLPRHNAN